MKGKGKFYYKNRDIYLGEFNHDKKKGYGMYFIVIKRFLKDNGEMIRKENMGW